jgi:NAD(P)-dependent dehydrogenase (short-subunit alcohol dehydrogenase family)
LIAIKERTGFKPSHRRPHIRINAVGPAFIDTPLLTKNLDAETIGQLAALHPIGRLGTPEEV